MSSIPSRRWLGGSRQLAFALLSWGFLSAAPHAPTHAAEPSPNSAATLLPHPEDARWWLSGQANEIFQWHPRFRAKYSGANSLRAGSEHALSQLYTVYAALQITDSTEIVVDGESAGGGGLSDALGVAGFPNLDVVRNPTLGATPYLARAWIRQVIPFSEGTVSVERVPHATLPRIPERRVEVYAGKLGMVDFFDLNPVGGDSHLQFMNWAIDNNAAYDYAADTRGYTYGAIVEYVDPGFAIRFGEGLMPKVANGIDLDADVGRARAETLEIELHPSIVAGRSGAVRLLSYVNHADMGSYGAAIQAFLAGRDTMPTIEKHRRQGRVKFGFGLNLEQEVTETVRTFARAGWNEGRHESFAYTEVNSAGSVGADLRGALWKREEDKVGLAFAINGISSLHRRYLALGGQGFLLGDGRLTYGTERIFETYYTLALGHGIFPAVDVQYIQNPGYNRDRGPVVVPGVRLHVDF